MAVTPMMQQYEAAKQACPDALLLFRMGDFYELFHEDAKTAHRVLGITLTSRDKGENPTPMAGFPHHQLESYLRKLIAAGYRAAVCDQMEDPRQAKGIVRREVTRIVSAGTLTDDALLTPTRANYLVGICPSEESGTRQHAVARPIDTWGVAWADLSTGEFWAAAVTATGLADLLVMIEPVEIVVPDELTSESSVRAALGFLGDVTRTPRPAWTFASGHALAVLTEHYRVGTLEGFGFDVGDGPKGRPRRGTVSPRSTSDRAGDPSASSNSHDAVANGAKRKASSALVADSGADVAALRAAGGVLGYLAETQKTSLDHFEPPRPFRPETYLEIDAATRRSLELTRTARRGEAAGSLIRAIDRTRTPAGGRLLVDWLEKPLRDIAAIEARHDAVDVLVDDAALRNRIRDELDQTQDIERIAARVATGRATPRDLAGLTRTLAVLPRIARCLDDPSRVPLAACAGSMPDLADLRRELEETLVEEPPNTYTDGGVIRPGHHEELDRLRELAQGGKAWIAKYQTQEAARLGIPSLKVGFNKVFGYYIELTAAQALKAPSDYSRKQTLKNGERFITPQLKEYEDQVLSASDRATELEIELFLLLRDRTAAEVSALREAAKVIARLDVILSLAELAAHRRYVRPKLVAEPVLQIVAGRHPVLEAWDAEGTFVPNDTTLGDEAASIALITGPNMAGKSTYIRQVALITLLAQMGSFVPAESAVIGVADRIFARVGASDELARGQSTFMVEMTETARILNTATARSLVILDEIGRGTSTFDGLALAWSITEYLHDVIACRTLFATHYHELTELARRLPGVTNLSVAVQEWKDQIVFLHRILEGPADKSYGIHVARLAGVPTEVSDRAEVLLRELESGRAEAAEGAATIHSRRAKTPASRRRAEVQLSLFEFVDHPLLAEIRQLDPTDLTAEEAIAKLAAWNARLRQEAS